MGNSGRATSAIFEEFHQLDNRPRASAAEASARSRHCRALLTCWATLVDVRSRPGKGWSLPSRYRPCEMIAVRWRPPGSGPERAREAEKPA